MKHQQTTLSGNGENALFYQSWWPVGTPRGLILLVHGAAEHGARYQHFAERVGQAGFAVATVDLPGHGRSSGRRCCIDSFDAYVDAVASAKLQALEEYAVSGGANSATLPVVLVGHSMGGLVASLYVHVDAELAGAVFSGAALAADPEPTPLQRRLMRFLAKWFPSLGVLQLDATSISRDADVVSTYQQDPLVFTGKLSASLLEAMFNAMERSRSRFCEVNLPILVMHGEADTLVPPLASQRLYDEAGSEDKTLRILPHLYHEIFNEPEGDEVIDQVVGWIERKLPAA